MKTPSLTLAWRRENTPRLMSLLLGIMLCACSRLPAPMPMSSEHITLPEQSPASGPPPLAEAVPLPPPPVVSTPAERYTVVVNMVPAQEILFALARDAKVNIEIHPAISGTATMNLIDQTLPAILDALSRQIDMRYELNGQNLVIMPDSPFLKHYQIDYPNVARSSENTISTSTSVAAIGQSGTAGGGSGNISSSSIHTISNNTFWETLTTNIKELLRETDKVFPEDTSASPPLPSPHPSSPPLADPGEKAAVKGGGESETVAAKVQGTGTTPVTGATFREASSVIANPETGTISVRATSRQHASVQAFLDTVMVSARRQVLIEATIVEVTLTDEYQQGIDWSILRNKAGWNFSQTTPEGTVTGVMSKLTYDMVGVQGGMFDLSASMKLLETFGTLHVLSSPKLSVLNNQTSLLKVVDEEVYFTIDVTPATLDQNGNITSPALYTSTVHTVPVGFLMYVTPQIGKDAEVTLNLRPTITRIMKYANDPNPALAQNRVVNLIPQIQTREMESILRVRNGDIAVLGGLMQDTQAGNANQIPAIGSIPSLGELFKSRKDKNSKSELVVFLRPVILEQGRQDEAARILKQSAASSVWRQERNATAHSAP